MSRISRFASVLVIPLGLDLYMPVPQSNPMTPAKIELGRRLFNDRRLSRDGSIACASCHDTARAFSDVRAVSVGVAGRTGRRNAPALINRGYGSGFFWDGRARSLEETVLQPIENPLEMDLPLEVAARRIGIRTRVIGEALATYVRSILSGNSRVDRFLSGERSALTSEEQAGLQIFRGKGNCIACHVGPNFTDERLHNTGIAWRTGQLTDSGGGNGVFKTPTLREIARTAPYMHDGSLQTLGDVIEFYDRGGAANRFLDPELHVLRLSLVEKRSLVTFLESLSGEVAR